MTAGKVTRRKNRVRKLLAQEEPPIELPMIGEIVVDQWGVPIVVDDVEEYRLKPHRRTKEQSFAEKIFFTPDSDIANFSARVE